MNVRWTHDQRIVPPFEVLISIERMNQRHETERKLNIWMPFLFAVVLIIGMLLGFKLQKGSSSSLSLQSKTAGGSIQELLRFIETKYVDETNQTALTEKAINGILKELDPHSTYITAEQLKSVNEELQGKFEGVGLQFTILEDTIYVVTPISGGPSDKLGILAGDKIVRIEDTLVAGIEISTEKVIRKLKGKKGTKVKITIMRGKKTIPYTITRDEIPLYSVDATYMLNENTGYIKVNRFSGTTYKEFVQGVEKLQEEGCENLVIDLRQNPGGYLNEAIKILNQLFEERKLLVYTEGRTYKRNNYKSTGRAVLGIDKIAVLIDEGSASASEILAGAIQDNDRGRIIGRRSFGKGLVQEQYNLSDGSAIRLTVARYYTPSGRSIQKSYSDKDAYHEETLNRLETGELENADSIIVADSTQYYTVGGRVVYGGGGISPDVFVPIPNALKNEYHAKLSQYIPQFVYNYMDIHRSNFEDYGSLERYTDQYQVSEKVFSEFMQYTEKQGIGRNEQSLRPIESTLKLRLKAYFARQLFRDRGYHYVMNSRDAMVKEAMKFMGSENGY